MAFVTGMMGPYMMPIPFNVPVAMIVSLVVAFVVTPWASYRLMKADHHGETIQPLEETRSYLLYKKVLAPMLVDAKKRKIFLSVIMALFVISMTFPLFQWVKFRMLPKAKYPWKESPYFRNGDWTKNKELMSVIGEPSGKVGTPQK